LYPTNPQRYGTFKKVKGMVGGGGPVAGGEVLRGLRHDYQPSEQDQLAVFKP